MMRNWKKQASLILIIVPFILLAGLIYVSKDMAERDRKLAAENSLIHKMELANIPKEEFSQIRNASPDTILNKLRSDLEKAKIQYDFKYESRFSQMITLIPTSASQHKEAEEILVGLKQIGTVWSKKQSVINAINMAKEKAEAEKAYKAKRKLEKANNKLKSPEIDMDDNTLYECSWGIPDHINRTKTAFGESQQWVYEGKYGHTKYVYLKNGIVTAIQD